MNIMVAQADGLISTSQLCPLPRITSVMLSCDCSLIVEVGGWPSFMELPLDECGDTAVVCSIDGDTLSIDAPTDGRARGRAEMRVCLPNLELIENYDAGAVTVIGTVSGDQLTLRNEGAGSVLVQAEGSVDTLDIEQDGDGPISCIHLPARKGLVTALRTSRGDVAVRVTGDLRADAWGAGTVRVHGEPTTRQCSVGDGAAGGSIIFEGATR